MQSARVDKALLRVGMFLESEIKLNILNWKARGHLWKHGALINSISYDVQKKTLSVVSKGVPYARVHEYGTVGKGGRLRNIKPLAPRKFLTIPMNKDYERKRARNFKHLHFVLSGGTAFLWDARRKRVAYWLVRSVSIPARPYFFPALNNNTAKIIGIIRAAMALEG
jgi:phage gpG-like protein